MLAQRQAHECSACSCSAVLAQTSPAEKERLNDKHSQQRRGTRAEA